MFNKTRRKIVFTVVASLLALLLVTLATIYVSNRITMRRENERMLRTYVELYDPDIQPAGASAAGMPVLKPAGEPGGASHELPGGKGPMRDEPKFRLSTFYAVAYGKSGEVLSINSGNNALQSEESLLALASSILEGGKESGSAGNIYYLVSDRGSYTLVAMIDGTIGDSNQQTLFREMLIIGAGAMAVLFAVSIFLARRIVRPLEENDRRQKRFVSDAGHELKTPIAVISANSELLRRQLGENEWLTNIDYENERMSELVKQLLALSRAENGETPRETIDFSRLVDGEVLPFETLAFEKGKRIVSETEPDILLEGNSNQLHQLVSILLDNALSHGTGEQTELVLRREHHSAVLTVSNDAEALDEEQLAHLFDRFYRADEARTGSDGHYGLGLSIAQAVAESHGGRITAEYHKPKVVFRVLLPVKRI